MKGRGKIVKRGLALPLRRLLPFGVGNKGSLRRVKPFFSFFPLFF
jgi:hypothetical protein